MKERQDREGAVEVTSQAWGGEPVTQGQYLVKQLDTGRRASNRPSTPPGRVLLCGFLNISISCSWSSICRLAVLCVVIGWELIPDQMRVFDKSPQVIRLLLTPRE